MFDFLRNLTKSDEEKRQERLSAYLDNALSPAEQTAFEQELGADTALQASLEQERLLKQNLSGLPRMRAPRNFTLDPALYGRPTAKAFFQLYPVMRTATMVAAIVLVFLFSLEFLAPYGGGDGTAAVSQNEMADVVTNSELAAEQPAPAEPEIFGAAGGDSETAVAEEAMEEEMMEPPMEEAAEEAAEAIEAEMAEAPTAPDPAAYPEGEASAADSDGGAAGGEEQAVTITGTESAAVRPIDGDQTVVPAITPTQRLTQSARADDFYNVTETAEAERSDTNLRDETPVPTRRLLQIGLGALFLALLAGTWYLRRQL